MKDWNTAVIKPYPPSVVAVLLLCLVVLALTTLYAHCATSAAVAQYTTAAMNADAGIVRTHAQTICSIAPASPLVVDLKELMRADGILWPDELVNRR